MASTGRGSVNSITSAPEGPHKIKKELQKLNEKWGFKKPLNIKVHNP